MAWIAPAKVLRNKTHCVHGHSYAETGVYYEDDGNRRCRECKRLRSIAYRQRRAA